MSEDNGFIKLPYPVYDSAVATLTPIEIKVLLLLIRKHNGRNNGNISLGVRETAKRCQCAQMTACRALKSLEQHKLITPTYKGHIVPEIGRPDVATRWRLNFVTETNNRDSLKIVQL